MPPLLALAGVLVWNLFRSRRGKSTMCSFTRPHVPPLIACSLWGGLTAWFLTHYCQWLPSWLRRPIEGGD